MVTPNLSTQADTALPEMGVLLLILCLSIPFGFGYVKSFRESPKAHRLRVKYAIAGIFLFAYGAVSLLLDLLGATWHVATEIASHSPDVADSIALLALGAGIFVALDVLLLGGGEVKEAEDHILSRLSRIEDLLKRIEKKEHEPVITPVASSSPSSTLRTCPAVC